MTKDCINSESTQNQISNEIATTEYHRMLLASVHVTYHDMTHHDSYAKARRPTGAFPNLGWYPEHIPREAGTSKLRFPPWWCPKPQLVHWLLLCKTDAYSVNNVQNHSTQLYRASAVWSTCYFAAKAEASNAHIKGLRHLDLAQTCRNRFEQQEWTLITRICQVFLNGIWTSGEMSVLYLHKEETVTLIWIAVKLQGHRQATATSTV